MRKKLWKLVDKAFAEATSPGHHIHKNGSTYWLSFTLISQEGEADRMRINLRTKDFEKAMQRRDNLFKSMKGKWITM